MQKWKNEELFTYPENEQTLHAGEQNH